MKYVNYEACFQHPDDSPNVAMVRVEGVRLVHGKIPRAVRNELMASVASGRLGHLKKDGLKPEAFFHPNSEAIAKERRNREASEAIKSIAAVSLRASDLTFEDQQKLLTIKA